MQFILCNLSHVLFLGSGMAIPYWDFYGTTMVTSNYIRLTPDAQSMQGALWNSLVSIISLTWFQETSLLKACRRRKWVAEDLECSPSSLKVATWILEKNEKIFKDWFPTSCYLFWGYY